MKLNITPGPWEAVGKTVYEKEGFEVASCSSYVIDYKILNDNQTAIITAVNNTYHAGIDPEAVPGMLEILKDIRLEQYLPIYLYKQVKEIIQKATL